MSLPLLTSADFVGDIKLSQNSFRTNQLQDYIDRYYPDTIADLIGQAALQEIEDAVTLPPKYVDLLEGTGTYVNTKGSECLCRCGFGYGYAYEHSYGYSNEENVTLKKPQLLELVKRIIYFQWVRDYSINTTSGDAKNISENAIMLSRAELQSNARQRYNWAIRRFNERVIPFICNYDPYTSSIDGINDLGGGVLEILSSDTIYLQDGDAVKIFGVDYVISNLVDNTSFEITASFSTAPTSYQYEPYKVIVYKHQNPVLF